MTDLEKQSGTITAAEEPTPHHGFGVDPKSITVNPVEQAAIPRNDLSTENKPGAFFTSMQESLSRKDVVISKERLNRTSSSAKIVRGM